VSRPADRFPASVRARKPSRYCARRPSDVLRATGFDRDEAHRRPTGGPRGHRPTQGDRSNAEPNFGRAIMTSDNENTRDEPTRSEHAWERGWEDHERQQRARLAKLSLAEKLQWLEEAHRMVRHMEAARKSGRASE